MMDVSAIGGKVDDLIIQRTSHDQRDETVRVTDSVLLFC
jgi:hypothetical protein